jgi:hypothetical protein
MPDSGNESEIQIDGMMASQLVHKPCVNGYSATSPKGFAGFWLSFNERELYNWLDFNQMDHATIVQIK